MIRQRILICFLVVSLALVAGFGRKDGQHRPSEAERFSSLEVVRPRLERRERRLELPATVEPMEKSDLCARVPGSVEFLPIDADIGRKVKMGEKLLRLAVPELEAQKRHKEALLEQARQQKFQTVETRTIAGREVLEAEKQAKRFAADFSFAQKQYERVAELVRRGSLTPERGQETERQMAAAEAAWEAAKALIDTKHARLVACDADIRVAECRIQVAQAEIHNLAVLIELATISAPFDGVITKRWVDRGATVKDPGVPLLTVMRLDEVRVLLQIPERDVPSIDSLARQGGAEEEEADHVLIRIPALDGIVPAGEFTGRITRLSCALDPATRTMRTEVHLDNRAGHLRPGMCGTATIMLGEHFNVFTIPSSALVRHGNRIEVYCLANPRGAPPHGDLQLIEVALGLDDGRHAEIRKGLKGDELVIVKPNGELRGGDRVIGTMIEEP